MQNYNKKKTLIWTAVVIVLVAVVSLLARYVFRGPFMYAGTLETTKVIISARVASDISEINVAEGDNVSKGQSLMRLSCDAYKILATQIDNDFNRAAELYNRGHMSQAEYDVIARNKQENDLKLNWCDIKSPIDGMVTTKFREVGEVVAPGTVLMTISNPYDIWAYFYVPYKMLHGLSVGQGIVGILPEVPGKTFNGKIIKINEEAEFTPKNVQTSDERMRLVYGVKVRFDNSDLTLKAGMTIESALTNE